MSSLDTQRIAKNTLFLYFRMILTMGVSLYTSRVVLNVLGVENYGVYSVVGGVVALFSFFNAAMASATQRFLSYDVGIGDSVKLKRTFNATVNIHILIAVVVFLLAEVIGLWFINNKLNVEASQIEATNWVFHFSLLTFIVSVIQVPYTALIISKERMNIYAYLSIVEVLLKLAIVYLLIISPFDKLKTYAVLIFCVSLLVFLFFRIYCSVNFQESKYIFYFNKGMYREIISFSGWNLFGNVAAIARGQGSNIVLNIFFGTTVNAAYGITSQVRGAVSIFVRNFQMAVNPQIIKTYAQNRLNECHKLIFQSSKLSYFLLFFITVPLVVNIDFVLELWLKNPPQYSGVFVQLALFNLLIDSISGPLMMGAQATGRIKWYQIILGTFIFLDLPLTYLILSVYREPHLAYVVTIIITSCTLVFRLFFLKRMISLDIGSYFRDVILRLIGITVISCFVVYFITLITFSGDWARFVYTTVLLSLINAGTISVLGLNSSERKFLIKKINEKIISKFSSK